MRACYEAIDRIVRAIYQSVNQESFRSSAQMETLLLKAAIASGDDYEAEFSFLKPKHNAGKMLRYRGAT